MSGVQTSLSLQDKLTGPLMKMMKAMDKTIGVMEKMDQSATNLDQKGLSGARKAITNASADMARLMSAMDDTSNSANNATNKQDEFNKSVSGGLPNLKSLATKLLGVVGAYKALSASKNFLSDMFGQGIQFQALKQTSEIALTTFLGDADKATKYMDDMYQFALTTPFAYPDLLESSRNLIAFGVEAENTFPIMQALGDAVGAVGGSNADIANAADIIGMIQSQGRITAMEVNRLAKYGVNAYQMLGDAAGVSADEMKGQISDGAVSASQAITGLVEGMNEKFGGSMAGIKGTILGSLDSMRSSIRNAGDKMMEDFMEPLTQGIGNVTSLIKRIPEYIGPAVAAFIPVIDMMNAAFEEGKFDWFFESLSMAINFVAFGISGIVQSMIWFGGVMESIWPFVITFFALLALTYIPTMLAGLGTMIATLYGVGAAWFVALGPVGWAMAAIAGLVGIMMFFGVTADQILGFVGGLFMMLATQVWNVVAHIYNFFAMLAEFLINIFIDPIYAIKKLFYDMAMLVIDQMGAMASVFDKVANVLASAFVSGANVAIGGINMLIKALNKIPGVNIGEVGEIEATTISSLADGVSALKSSIDAPTTDKNVVNMKRMEVKDLGAAYQTGSQLKLPSFGGGNKGMQGPPVAPGLDMPQLNMGFDAGALGKEPKGAKVPKGAKNPTGGKLDSVGKIKDDINIADEDLKLLLDAATNKSIVNNRTLNPTINLTGTTVREEGDIDKIVSKITKVLQTQVNESVEGIYT